MSKGISRPLGWGRLLAGALMWIFVLTVPAAAQEVLPASQGRSDVIIIDVLKAHGPLERPAVRFYHDKHTEALAKQKKDCLACHNVTKDRLTPAFGRTEEMSKQTAMQTFHDRCIGCHKESAADAQTKGPVTCGDCHVKDAALNILWAPIDLDKGLHYRHVQASDQKCEQCHHQFNEQTKKLVYIKGQEGACLYCHKDRLEENRISARSASHLACVGCHRQKTAAGLDAGPIQCAGCHDPRLQALIQRPDTVPRMKRNQPDTVLVKTMSGTLQDSSREKFAQPMTDARMASVPFDHKAHEGYNATCKQCHHAGLQSCAQCHTIEGSADAKQVKLAQAMHQQDAGMSCVGCHNEQKKQTQCVGCHHSMPLARTLTSPTACKTCHLAPPLENDHPTDKDQSAALAAGLLSNRKPVRGTVGADQIPETVIIKTLAQDYQAVELPHRRIVLALTKAIQGSDLAAHFHTDPLTLCQGCHHNSPASLKPPQCGSCHGRSSEALNLTRPGLLAAYHQQCIECHDSMGIEKPASRECTACHAKRQ